MKKLILPLTIFAAITFSCTTEKPTGTTILSFGTPYGTTQEIMAGKVKTVVEKYYWAIPDGDSYKKGNPFTKADRESWNGWSEDFEALYDENGVFVNGTGLDENGNPIWKNESVIQNKQISRMNEFIKDTLKQYVELKYGDNGFVISGRRIRGGVDTLMESITIKTNAVGYPTEFLVFNTKGEPTVKVAQTYDEQNRFTKLETINKEGKTTFSCEGKYNDKGKISELVLRDKDNKVTASNYLTYEYDTKGNWVKAIVKNDKNHVVIAERSYTYYE
jgi:hypothetical protein